MSNKICRVFKSVNCSPCRQMAPHLDKLAKEGYPIEFVPEDAPTEFIKFGVVNVPTILIMDGEEILRREVGYKSEQQLTQLFNENGLTTES